ncbi:DMT family transporter [bacterium]|nr:DMT family transporter [bacterium]
MSKPSEYTAYAALVTTAIVWGGSIVGQKWALGSFSPVETSVLRGVGALAILVPLWWVQEGRGVRFSSSDVAVLSGLGLGVLGNHLGVLFGLRYIGAAEAGIIIGASPAITAFLSSLILKDVPFRSVWLGCAISFGGVALVSGGETQGVTGDRPLLGGALVVLALVSWALYSIVGRRIMERLSPLTVNWTTLSISIVMQIPLLWTDPHLLSAGIESVPLSGWVALLYLIVFATALGQQTWLYGVKGVGPARAGIFTNLIPVSALLLSALMLGETIGVREVAGILLILLGVWLVNR